MRRIKRHIKQASEKSLIRYLLVGAVAFLAEYVVFLVLFYTANLPLYLANSVSFVLGLAVSFMLNRSWAFGGEEYAKRAHHQLIMYTTLAFVNLGLTNVLIGTLRSLDVAPVIGKLLVMCMIVAWNFLLFRYVIFAPKRTGL